MFSFITWFKNKSPSPSPPPAPVDKNDTVAEVRQSSSSEGSKKVLNLREEWNQGKQNPRNWTALTKWSIVIALWIVDLSVSWTAVAYAAGEKEFQETYNTSDFVRNLGYSIYILGLAIGPLLLAPCSEYFGRLPVYLISYFIFMLLQLGVVFVKNVPGFMVLRFLAGCFVAVTISNFGGTISDLWDVKDTGNAMSLYMGAATMGAPSGIPVLAPIQQYYGQKIVFGALLAINAGFFIIMCTFVRETRRDILFARHLAKTNKKEGATDCPETSIKKPISKTLQRPFVFLIVESIVQFCASYNGILFGISFLFVTAQHTVYEETYGFDLIQVGYTFFGTVTGIVSGIITDWTIQEPWYQKQLKKHGRVNMPEKRVMMSTFAGFTLPISLLCFGFSAQPSVHFIVPVIFSALWGWSFYTIVKMTFIYAEDAYQENAASALAGIGFVRNVVAFAFPLFGGIMFKALGTQASCGILAGIGLLLAPVPLVLFFWGHKLRAASPYASEHVEDGPAPQDIEMGSGVVAAPTPATAAEVPNETTASAVQAEASATVPPTAEPTLADVPPSEANEMGAAPPNAHIAVPLPTVTATA